MDAAAPPGDAVSRRRCEAAANPGGWSPEGTTIAFQCDVDGDKENSPTAFTQIWTVNADGTGARDTGIQCSDIGCDPRWRPNWDA